MDQVLKVFATAYKGAKRPGPGKHHYLVQFTMRAWRSATAPRT